jgi:hypothetical protein
MRRDGKSKPHISVKRNYFFWRENRKAQIMLMRQAKSIFSRGRPGMPVGPARQSIIGVTRSDLPVEAEQVFGATSDMQEIVALRWGPVLMLVFFGSRSLRR